MDALDENQLNLTGFFSVSQFLTFIVYSKIQTFRTKVKLPITLVNNFSELVPKFCMHSWFIRSMRQPGFGLIIYLWEWHLNQCRQPTTFNIQRKYKRLLQKKLLPSQRKQNGISCKCYWLEVVFSTGIILWDCNKRSLLKYHLPVY